jgi:hypothetical protein
MSDIQWTPPNPRSGILGAWDRFVGPGATPREEAVQVIGTLALSAMLGLLLYTQRDSLNWTILQSVVVALFVFDITGGIVTNATSAAKRWYHRPGNEGSRAHMPFIIIHGIHLFVIAALFLEMDWVYFGVNYGYLLLAALLVIATPLYLQRPVSLVLFSGGLLLGISILEPAAGLEWFLPFFYLKLLVSHLPKEAPFTPESR